MDRGQRTRTVGLVVIGIAVLGLLTLTAVGARSLPGTTRSVALSWTIDAIQIIQVAVGVLIVAAIVWSLINTRRDDVEDKPRRKAPPRRKSGLAILIVIAAIALLIWVIPQRAGTVLEEPSPSFSFSDVDFLPIENVGAAWPLLVLVALAALAIFALSVLTRPSEQVIEAADPASLVAGTLGDAIDELSWSDDPRSVIIKAYYRIESGLAAAGLPRRPSEAPREYLERVLAGTDVKPDSITSLTTLFELARFSDQELAATDRDAAEAAMRSVLEDLGATTS
jgi:Domain of unknown function (DUF4129)